MIEPEKGREKLNSKLRRKINNKIENRKSNILWINKDTNYNKYEVKKLTEMLKISV